MMVAQTEHHRGGRAALLIGALAVLPYMNSLQCGFTFDDEGVIWNNPLVTGPSASALRLVTTVRYLGAPLYRPVTMLTYLADARPSESPFGYHLVNLVLHVLVTLAVLRLAWILLDSPVGAMATAALFAVHPIHTEAVTSIVGRAELLVALFVFAALLASLWAAQRRGTASRGWLLVSLLALALGLLAKESALSAVPLAPIAYVWTRRRYGATVRAAVFLPYLLLAVTYVVARLLVVGALGLLQPPDFAVNPLAYVPVLPRAATALVILWQYLSALALPILLSADYSFNQIPVVASAFDPRLVVALAGFVALAVVLAACIRRAPALIWAAAFLFVPLALTANVLFPIGTIKAERLLYLPSFGWCLAGGWIAMQGRGRRGSGWSVAMIALVVAAYAGRTWVRNRDWQDNVTLFAATVQDSPASAKAHYNLGVAYDHAGLIEAAMPHFRQAFAIDPTYADAAFGVGRMYEKKGLDAAARLRLGGDEGVDDRVGNPVANLIGVSFRHRLAGKNKIVLGQETISP